MIEQDFWQIVIGTFAKQLDQPTGIFRVRRAFADFVGDLQNCRRCKSARP
jgi:hypothetical protein